MLCFILHNDKFCSLVYVVWFMWYGACGMVYVAYRSAVLTSLTKDRDLNGLHLCLALGCMLYFYLSISSKNLSKYLEIKQKNNDRVV